MGGGENEGRGNRCNDVVCVAGKILCVVSIHVLHAMHHYHVGSLPFRPIAARRLLLRCPGIIFVRQALRLSSP